jgi:5-methylcytosine-specific restriction endonuclease McrA
LHSAQGADDEQTITSPDGADVRRFRGFEREERAAILSALIARDGSICGICEGPLYPDIVNPDHKAATTIDHIVPLSDGGEVGGSERLGNLRLAHSLCNSLRVKNGHLKPRSFAKMLQSALNARRAAT